MATTAGALRRSARPARRRRKLTAVPAVHVDAPRDFTACRALGHSWQHRRQPLADEELRFRAPLGIDYQSRAYASTCTSCGTSRTKWVARSGATMNRYAYAEGYQRRGEDERVSPQEWRSAWVVADLDTEA